MVKPDIKIEGDKVVLDIPILGLDLDGDGVKSLEIAVSIKANKAEAIHEIMKKALAQGKLPDWLSAVIGK